MGMKNLVGSSSKIIDKNNKSSVAKVIINIPLFGHHPVCHSKSHWLDPYTLCHCIRE